MLLREQTLETQISFPRYFEAFTSPKYKSNFYTSSMKSQAEKIDSFDLSTNHILAGKYQVLEKLGSGWEGEVYKIREIRTGIERAAKFFYPERNPKNKNLKFYAIKLHKLKDCSILIQYHTEETIVFKKTPITFLVSEFVAGDMLSVFLKNQKGNRLHPYQGLHLLYALVKGFEEIHSRNEYHGDLHSENIMVCKQGLGFELKLLDMIHWKTPKKENIQDDICDMIRIFYDSIGGSKHYSKHPKHIKEICCGLKRTLILQKFKTTSHLRKHLETMCFE